MSWREREAEVAAIVRECRAALALRGRTVIDEAVGETEVSSGLLVCVAFGYERENCALALGRVARRLKGE